MNEAKPKSEQNSSLNFNSNQSLKDKQGKSVSLHELFSLSQESIANPANNQMNHMALQAMSEITGSIKAMSGEQVEAAQPIQLKLSSIDRVKLGQSKTTKASEFSTEPSKKSAGNSGPVSEERASEQEQGVPVALNESLSQRVKNMFPGFFSGSPNDTKLEGKAASLRNEHNLVVFNDRMTLDKLESEIKPPELALLEKEESFDIFSVSPSLINFENELDINEANELAITRRIYMN